MYEIWWRDRLLDVVPRVGELPEGLSVRARSAVREPISPTERDWRFPKILVMALLFFGAVVSTLQLTPPAADDGWAPSAFMSRLVVFPTARPPPVKAAQHLKEKAARELFAAAAQRPGAKVKGAGFNALWGTVGELGAGLGPIDQLLAKLGGGGGGPDASLPGFGGPRGAGPGVGGGFHIGGPSGGPRLGPGVGAGLGPKRDEGPPHEVTVISDGLSRDLVAKTIRAHANEIKYCYERELQSHQSLSGKVAVTFTIGPTGEVVEASISESTLQDESVESCMLSRVRRWKFPEPAGGGVVTVNHPWIFRGAGDNTP